MIIVLGLGFVMSNWFTELNHQLTRRSIAETFNLMSLKGYVKETSRISHSDFVDVYVHYTYPHISNENT